MVIISCTEKNSETRTSQCQFARVTAVAGEPSQLQRQSRREQNGKGDTEVSLLGLGPLP